MVKFVLKCGKDTMEIEQEAQQSFQDFQAKVYTLTNIPPKNLKLLCKSKMIKDQQTLMKCPEESQILVMGTKQGKELKKAEHINIDTKMVEQQKIPQRYGITNIGNTCYQNAAIQFLRAVPQFEKLVKQTKITNNNSTNQIITGFLKGLFNQIDKKDVVPKAFVSYFLGSNPEFTPFGQQFDSDQFMQKLLQTVSQCSPEHEKTIKQIFQIEMLDTITNRDNPDEKKFDIHNTMKLCCSLGGVEKEIKVGTLVEGIRLSLQGDLQKISELDNNSHIFSKVSRFNKLPKHLLVQMIRFFWKQADNQFNSKAVATKICKSIDYAMNIDVFDFCTPQLQKQLQKGRQAYDINKKKDQEQYKKEYEQYKQSLGETNRPETRIIEEFKQIWKKKQSYLSQGLQTGMYEMRAVVTHLGHSIESGHYMAWVKETEDQWMKYDDDTVYPQPQAKVAQLRGGQPNLQIAYLILFRKVYTRPV